MKLPIKSVTDILPKTLRLTHGWRDVLYQALELDQQQEQTEAVIPTSGPNALGTPDPTGMQSTGALALLVFHSIFPPGFLK
jgi:hypothetical protein